MIRAVIFDWGGVLIDDVIPFLITYIAHHFGVRRDDLLVQMMKYTANFAKGVMDEETFWKNICEALRILKPRVSSLWKEAINAGYAEKHDVFLLIDSLKNQGYNIGLLSNCEMPVVEIFHERGYRRYFDAAIFSCTEGVCKPDERIYKITLEGLDVEPDEAVFIDDKEENVRAAQKFGMRGIVFINPGQIREELKLLLNNKEDV